MERASLPVPEERRREWRWLLGASLLVAAGLTLAGLAKMQNFGEIETAAERNEVLNLNHVESADQLAPFLTAFPTSEEREAAAEKIFPRLDRAHPLPNVGALARVRVTQEEIDADPRWSVVRKKLEEQQARRAALPAAKTSTIRIALLPLAKLKPFFIVRTQREFVQRYAIWCAIYLLSFWVVHFAWRWRRFHGDATILPVLQLISGMGLLLSVSLRDPLRDTLEFSKFAWGCSAGCLLLLLPLLKPLQYKRFATWIYTPLLAAFALFVLLVVAGSGPTGTDSKVNLGPFQPVEAIKILIAFFLAGYFTKNWEKLRDLREKRLVPGFLRWLEIPRAAHALPVMIGVSGALGIFFVLHDLGPALVTGFLFLTMFAIARGRFGLALLGIAILVAGVTIGYQHGTPHTVVERIGMWLSPWDNDVRGGDQLAHSIWALSTGGWFGSGPGFGDPAMIPAGHTDLVLPAIGEEWGFAGVLTVGLLLGFLIERCFRTALRAADEYGLFLAASLGILLSLEMLLITGGVLGAIPLSGVVSPFLSSGNSAMLANFFVFALIAGISNHRRAPDEAIARPFGPPVKRIAMVMAGCALILLGRAAYFQVWAPGDYVARDARVIEDDGVKRGERNPRINALAREIPRGNIYDRNGVLLATSDWHEITKRRAEYEGLGVALDKQVSALDSRHYPFGATLQHILGDLRTGLNFHATNASLIEHDLNVRLQGYEDAHELAPLLRYRHQPGHAALRPLLDRKRDVKLSIDVRLQLAGQQILERSLQAAGKDKGAAVILSVPDGEVLAMLNVPLPQPDATPTPDQLLDRARYGVYPPGSTFKIVTAMAALRLNPDLAHRTFTCRPLSDGRVGTEIPGWRRLIRDDIGDHAHGTIAMDTAITVSCNAYFAQMGTLEVGVKGLTEMTNLLEISSGDLAELKKMMPFASYGQGPILVTPFKMARVAATVASGGKMPQGKWVIDDSNRRVDPPKLVLPPGPSAFVAHAMRSVVTGGTGRTAMAGVPISIAGKTGTAQLDEGEPHSWFAGFAPFDGDGPKRIAFAVLVEHGGYGGRLAAPVARELVEASRRAGLIDGDADPKFAIPSGVAAAARPVVRPEVRKNAPRPAEQPARKKRR